MNNQVWKWASLAVLIAFGSCSTRSNSSQTAWHSVAHTLTYARKVTEHHNETIYASLQEHLKDSLTAAKARVLQPKVLMVKEVTTAFITQISQLNGDKKPDGLVIWNSILRYRHGLLMIDDLVAKEFGREIEAFPVLDSAEANAETFIKTELDHLRPVEVDVFAEQLLLQTRILEGRLIAFYHEQPSHMPLICDFVTPIINQSSTAVLPAQTMTITAGIGAILYSRQPVIVIGGKKIPLQDDAMAKYSLKAPLAPGTYTLPIVITYKDFDGKKMTYEKKISYTVLNK